MTLLVGKHVTDRNPQECDFCRAEIPAGVTHTRETHVGDDGWFYAWRTCGACATVVPLVVEWRGEGWREGISRDDVIAWALWDQDVAGAAEFLRRAGLAPVPEMG